MKKYISTGLLISTAFMLAPSASAQSNDEPHLYGGISYERINVDIGKGINFDSILLRGGYRFSKYFGAEAEIGTGFKSDTVRLGNVDTKWKSGVTAGIYGVGFVPISDRFDLVGRVGYKRFGLKAKTPGATTTANDTGLAWSAGAQYYLTETSGLRFDYSQASGGDVKTVTLGYQVRF